MSRAQLLIAGRGDRGAMTGRYTNVFHALTRMAIVDGTTYSVSPTVGAPAGSRYVVALVHGSNDMSVTIGGVAATSLALSSFLYAFTALVPTGTAPTIVVTGLVNNQAIRILVYSMQASSAPVLSVAASPGTGGSGAGPAATVPTNGFMVGYALAVSSEDFPSNNGISSGYTLNDVAFALAGTIHYTFLSAQINPGLTGSHALAVTWGGAITSYSNNQLIFS